MTDEGTVPAAGRECRQCKGAGKIFVICALYADGRGGPDVVGCPTCSGTGRDTRPEHWLNRGQAMRDERIARGLSLREEANRRGIKPSTLSDMELGRREPA